MRGYVHCPATREPVGFWVREKGDPGRWEWKWLAFKGVDDAAEFVGVARTKKWAEFAALRGELPPDGVAA